jgi:hypothetical protein
MRKLFRLVVLAGWTMVMGGILTESTLAVEKVANFPVPTTQIAYDGWVHVQIKKLDPDKPKDADDQEDSNAKPPEIYLNQAKGLLCTIMDFGDRKLIRLRCPQTGQMVEYDSQYSGVAYGTMDPALIKKTHDEIAKYPITLNIHLAALKDAGAIFMGSKEALEKNLLKVTIAYVGGKTCTTCPDNGGLDVLWIDPKTSLIHKLRTQIEHPQEITFTYDKKERNDIYAFGAPRDAKVSDSRPTPQAAQVLNRFDKHNLEGLGNFVGVLTETDQRKEWGTKKMFLYLYGQEDNKMFYAVYEFNPSDYPDSLILNLPGWPKVDIKKTLDLARKTIPLIYYATDGQSAWLGKFDTSKENKSRMLESKQLLKNFPPPHDHFLIHHFWRNREALFLYGYGPPADTLTDNEHPGLIGLRLREGDYTPSAKNTIREEWIFWVDPSRNDLPIQSIHRGERITNKPNTLTQFDTRFLDFARLPNGTWYPIHWKTQASREDFLAKTKGGYGREFFLQIAPNMKLEKTWYDGWAKAMGIEPLKMNFKEQKGK